MTYASTIIRNDEVIYKKIDQVTPYLKYIGRADFGGTPASPVAPVAGALVWQILRITISGNVMTQEYANKGSFTASWTNRSSYFAAFTDPTTTATQGALTVGTSAVLINVSGTDLADRKLVTLNNNSAVTLYWGWSSGVTTSSGTPIAAGADKIWVMENEGPPETMSVQTIYVIAGTAGNNARVTESP